MRSTSRLEYGFIRRNAFFLFVVALLWVSSFPVVAQQVAESEASIDFGPEQDAKEKGRYQLPPGPVEGGVLRVPHPDAKKGLIRINKDGTYLYRTQEREKSQTITLRAGQMQAPVFQNDSGIDFIDIYGEDNLLLVSADYEWIPFQQFGMIGLVFGFGFSTVKGNGVLQDQQVQAQEEFTLYVIPLSVALKYRFEFMKRQWFVPYLKGVGTLFGLAESRDDRPAPNFGKALAVGGGGGVNFSLTRWSRETAFILDSEYGIADFWLTAEFMATKGLEERADFSNNMVSVGLAFDY